jgi:cytochrome P450
MLYYLARYPEVQARMQDEADVVLGNARLPTDMAALEQLQLIEAVANETMVRTTAARASPLAMARASAPGVVWGCWRSKRPWP